MGLTLGYVGIFSLILILLLAIALVGLSRELTEQQDDLLAQEARNQTANLLNDAQIEVLASGSDEFAWAVLDPDGRVTDTDSSAPYLGLPHPELAHRALQEDDMVSTTTQSSNGSVRVVSMPMYESGEVVGVIQYARSLQLVQETVNRFMILLIPLGLGGLGLAVGGGLYMAGRAVRPVQASVDRQRAFIADASHELRTPLTLIRTDTEVLQRRLTDPEDKELTDYVLAETDRMDALVSDLLLAARLDAKQLTVSQETFDLASAISAVADRFATQAASMGIRLEVRATGNLSVLGDRARTEQILGVLFENALTYTPQDGSVTVIGRLQNGFVEAVVKDTGPGISPEHLPHIFERFYRADPSRSRSNGGGTGLGLSIARDLARVQKGSLEAENAKGGGAVFRLALPKG